MLDISLCYKNLFGNITSRKFGESMTTIIRKLIRRKNKKYYEATDVLTKKEKRVLYISLSIVVTPIVIAFGIILIN
jgi:hypothetical protein